MNKIFISRSPDIMGGTPVFAGTRVPVQTLLDMMAASTETFAAVLAAAVPRAAAADLAPAGTVYRFDS